MPATSSPDSLAWTDNTVHMDRERGEFSKNAIIYQFAVTTPDDEFKEFKQASSDPLKAPR
ncbi:MAG: hypothetical protein Q7K57_43690 [Burkholderiaceae bacterium]|nr:hypothetical protein [Burkholderiaceae bacterium]